MADEIRHRVLVVDDELLNVELMRAYLEDDYEVITAYNGADALDIIKNEVPEMVLLDVMMPDMDGYEVCRVIRQDYQMDFIPIIMITALTSRDDHRRGIEAGADDFLKKPVGKFDLEKKMTSLLRIKEKHDTLLIDRNKAYDYLDCVGVLVAVLDQNFNLTHINKKGLELTGYDYDNAINTSWVDSFVPADYGNHIRRGYNDLISGRTEEHQNYEYPVVIKSGEARLFKWYDSLLFGGDGSITGILISGEDITDKRLSEVKLQEYATQLEHSNELKDLFTDIMRHDLLNPASIVQSFTEMLEEKETDEKKLQIIENIKNSNARMISLIEGAAHLAKLEATDEIIFVKVDIASLLIDSVNNFSLDMADKTMNYELLFDGKYFAYANPMVKGVFSNLVSNAVKYGADNSTLKIRIDDIGEFWKVNVIDQGEGIADDDKKAIFERFKRLHKENIRGTGIGLAIVKRIVDLHGGLLGVSDNPESQGSIFWLTLKKA
jgi:two-component system cell cycle response regulator